MKAILSVVMGLALAVAGCSSNDCEDAMDKLEECDVNFGAAQPSDDEVSECNASAECGAKCINDASCADIKGALALMENSFTTCMNACPDE